MSLISRLRAVVAGDDYLDGELDDFAYDDEQDDPDQRALQADGGALATIGDSNPFDLGGDLPGSNVIGMPGISNAVSEVNVMEPRSFDEMLHQKHYYLTMTHDLQLSLHIYLENAMLPQKKFLHLNQ